MQICLNGRSCAALDACISPCHDVTIQNPPNRGITDASIGGNAFDKCEQLDQPKWLRFLPADANDLWREDFLELAPKASNAFAAGMVHKHSARKLRQVKCANIE